MAYFAKVNEENLVEKVAAIPDEFEADPTNYINEWFGEGNWIQTSFTGRIRGVFARPGYTYDPVNDVFIVGEEIPVIHVTEEVTE
jgi:hypothetical protein